MYYLNEILIQKKNGVYEDYDAEKIIKAIGKSAERTLKPLSDEETAIVLSEVERNLIEMTDNVVKVELMHVLVETALNVCRPDVAEQYRNYRSFRKKWSAQYEDLKEKTNSLMFLGDNDNANADSKLASTITCLTAGYWGTMMYEDMFLLKSEKQAISDGYIYIHDRDKRYTYPLNCCLFDAENVLKGGFEMANMFYNEPNSLDTAFDVLGDVILSASSQQYGGFTIPEVDKLLDPYAEKSYAKQKELYLSLGVSEEKADEQAYKDVLREMTQGFQGWEYKFNTVASSRGDYPFITVTAGLSTSRFGRELSKALLNVRAEGQGKKGFKKPVLFPKIVFLYDEELHGKGKELEDVFEAGIDCSSKAMYPDWLSLTGDSYVSEMYKKYKTPISPMGCRAFLSPYYEKGGFEPADENDKPVFVGRFNIGAVSLHLPMIYQRAKMDGKDFYELLDYYLDMIRKLHIRTYEYLGEMKAMRNPLAFCEGGLYGGHLNPEDKIAPLLKSATASFGVTALNELQRLYNGKSIAEDGEFAMEVMQYINKEVERFKKEDGHLYAVYGTPAEKLCGTQVTQFRKMFGIIKNVSDREYVSNSFHCHVTENIDPITKQDKEKRFWQYFKGGEIQYVRYNVGYNKEAIRVLVRRAMKMGFYEGVNLALSYCEDCGHKAVDIGDECPVCGSTHLTKINRTCGYLGFYLVKGNTRFNKAKANEISQRMSM